MAERRHLMYLDFLKDPLALISRDGRIVDINRVFARVFDIKLEAAVGADCRNVEPLSLLWNQITESMFKRTERTEALRYRGMDFEVTIAPVMLEEGIQQACLVLRDVTSALKLEAELLKRNRELMISNSLSEAFIASEDMSGVYDELLQKVLLIADLPMGWIVTQSEGTYKVESSLGLSAEFKDKLFGGEMVSLYDTIINTASPLYVLDSTEAQMPEAMRKEGFRFFASLPLRSSGKVHGMVMLAGRNEVAFDFDFASVLAHMSSNMSLISEKVSLFQETRRIAVTDNLTGLYNMRYLYAELEHEIERCKRYGSCFSIILYDLDNFKRINDTFGHQAGDKALLELSEILRKTSRKADTVARYGGEEFIIILPQADKDVAMRLAERIKLEVEGHAFLEGEELKITMSGGVSMFPEDGETAQEILYAADMAMYQAKALGKHRIVGFRKIETEGGDLEKPS